ncbi:apolipoprotein D-like [Cololabis saira]|uniref:apolipoprotein D-like n=1 Tax=Cololabis saira TaxID=129043 RepID=UPI002AD414F5|nr:apolipoprotein D-like [Cololabis saira]
MNTIGVFSLTLLSALAAHATVIAPGRCPNVAVHPEFDITKYLGKWYEIQKLPNFFELGQCGTATYSLISPGVVGVFNRELLPSGATKEIYGSAVSSRVEPAKLQVKFYENTRSHPYWVLSTDYDNYALVYSCSNYGAFHLDLAWILSRHASLPQHILDYLHSILVSIGVNVDKLITTNQDAAYCGFDKSK